METETTMLEWNQATGKYEADFAGHRISVSGDVISEMQQDNARERFYTDYANLDAVQTARVDAEVLAAYGWDEPDYYASDDDGND